MGNLWEDAKGKCNLTSAAKSVIYEISHALDNCLQTGQTATIFIDKLGLSQDERSMIHSFLGQGTVAIQNRETHEAVEWQESGVAGVWFAAYYGQNKNLLMETIEVGMFPILAGAQLEDIEFSWQQLQARLKNQ